MFPPCSCPGRLPNPLLSLDARRFTVTILMLEAEAFDFPVVWGEFHRLCM